jgi:tetratricopeptide (TPR) repeat protein
MRLPANCVVLLAFVVTEIFFAPARGQQPPDPDLSSVLDLIRKGNLPAAEKKLLEADRARPGLYQVQRLLGAVYEKEEKYPDAEAALERAARLSKQPDPEDLFLLCKVEFALNKTAEAVALARHISELKDIRPLYAVGRLLRENGQGGEAIVVLEKARSLAPQNPAIATELVAAYLDERRNSEAQTLLESLLNTAGYEDLIQAGSRLGEANKFGAAVEAFERAAQLRPAAYDGLFDLAFAYFRQGSFSRSLDTLDHIHRVMPASQNADYHYLRGKVEAALHHDQAAAEEFRGALRLQPDNESICVDAGLFFSRFQDFWKALGIFQACSRKLDDSVAVQTGLGLTYFHLGKYPDAIKTFRKVLALYPQGDAAREALSFLLYISGGFADARKLLEERMSAPKGDFYIYFLHALVLLRLDARGNRAAATRSLNEALARNPNFAPAYFQRGKIMFESGDFKRALADLETATRLDPAYAQPYYLIAQIYFKQGNRAEAEQTQAKFNSLNREREEKEQEQQVENRLMQALQ